MATVTEKHQALLQQATDKLSQEAKAIRIQIGSATCEHAAGSQEVYDEFRKHIRAAGRTDIELRRTGCTGRCSREPIVGIQMPDCVPVNYEQVDRSLVHDIFTQHIQGGQPLLDKVLDGPLSSYAQYEVLFCSGAGCGRDLEYSLLDVFRQKLEAAGLTDKVRIYSTHCFGLCSKEKVGKVAHLLVRPSKVVYRADEAGFDRIIAEHLADGNVVADLVVDDAPIGQKFFDLYGDVAFFNRQRRVTLRNCGVLDPESLEEYLQYRGFEALATVLEKGDPDWAVETVTKAKLRGRGGAGFPTGLKWASARTNEETERYIVCNADEGDPGAFMDRSVLESDPFNVVEGMIIGGYAVGAQRGFFYIRAEYPLAIERVKNAIAQCRAAGLLGDNILGSDFSFDLEIRLGAGAFVCGEETALLRSIEGERGQPRIRPPYPSVKGLWGKPTVINNVETFANIALIFNYGPKWFANLGTEKSGGTKVFALAGKVRHTGLVEVPMGTTLREIIYDIGGGIPGGKELKAVQTGGPAGGCIPADKLDTPVDYETLGALGSIMGSGGMIVLDEDDCMVDIAKFFITFTQDESCGKCAPCREGTKRMKEFLERLTCGKGTAEDVEKLERLGNLVRRSSLCGLGRAAPNPVLSTLKMFKDEYVEHVEEGKCRAHKCTALVKYVVNAEKCVGCTLCARNCPVQCISGARKEVHLIDQDQCIKCGRCYEGCRFGAIDRL